MLARKHPHAPKITCNGCWGVAAAQNAPVGLSWQPGPRRLHQSHQRLPAAAPLPHQGIFVCANSSFSYGCFVVSSAELLSTHPQILQAPLSEVLLQPPLRAPTQVRSASNLPLNHDGGSSCGSLCVRTACEIFWTRTVAICDSNVGPGVCVDGRRWYKRQSQ